MEKKLSLWIQKDFEYNYNLFWYWLRKQNVSLQFLNILENISEETNLYKPKHIGINHLLLLDFS